MTTWEWLGLILFMLMVLLLFFAAFGGSNVTDESVEECMTRLMQKRDKDGSQAKMSVLQTRHISEAANRFLCRRAGANQTLGMPRMSRFMV